MQLKSAEYCIPLTYIKGVKMKTLKLNLKIFYKSIWFILMMGIVLLLSVISAMTSKCRVGFFCVTAGYINVFLLVFTAVAGINIIHRTSEFEYSILSPSKLILSKYFATCIFSVSSVAIPVVLIIALSVINSVPPAFVLNNIMFIIISIVVQSVFITALCILIGIIIKNRAAYIVAVIISLIFSPLLQTLFRTKIRDNYDFFNALLSLINITYDDTYRIRLFSQGAQINTETVLSWIITSLISLFIIGLCIFTKSKKSAKKISCFFVAELCAITLCSISLVSYFDNSPVRVDWLFSEPLRADSYNASDLSSNSQAVVTDYDMKLTLGSIVSNDCEMTVKTDGETNIMFKLDNAFIISAVTVNGADANYSQDGNYVTISAPFSDNPLKIGVTYSGRVNYLNILNSKINYSDYFSSHLTDIFAWYPKILNSGNKTERNFNLEITPNNTFVTNLNGAALMKNEKTKISGKATDIFIYSGYITETYVNDRHIILPCEAVNYELAQRRIKLYIELFENKKIPLQNTLIPNSSGIIHTSGADTELNHYVFIPVQYNSVGDGYGVGDCVILCEATMNGVD